MYVDAHVHLDRYPDPAGVARAARAAAVRCLAVTESPAHHAAVGSRLGAQEGVEIAVGAHPLHAASLGKSDLELLDRAVRGGRFVGEVGLDGSPQGRASLPAQRRAFAHLLAHPDLRAKVLTVHSRDAEAEVIAALAGAGARAVLHWFRGSPDDARAALAAGLAFSINPAMIDTAQGRELIGLLPRERVLTETDGPYTSVGARPATPADIPVVIDALARAWQVDAEYARRCVADNWRELTA